MGYSPPREEGWLRHKENFGEAHLNAADGVVTRTEVGLVSDHPGRFAASPPHEEGNLNLAEQMPQLRFLRLQVLLSSIGRRYFDWDSFDHSNAGAFERIKLLRVV